MVSVSRWVSGVSLLVLLLNAFWTLDPFTGQIQHTPSLDNFATIIEQALGDMDALGIRGKDATPYLLGRIVEITSGESLKANIALVEDNARLGAAIAQAYAGR